MYKMLLLASYCNSDDENCSEEFPCDDCLKMCNVFDVEEKDLKSNYGGFEYNKNYNKYKFEGPES